MTARTCLLVAALSGGLAVTLGAFGAHGLNDTKYLERTYADLPEKTVAGMEVPASWKYFRDFETAVDYQFMHTAALLACGLLPAPVRFGAAISLLKGSPSAGRPLRKCH